MKILVTGMNGTVAPVLADRLSRIGHTIVRWDRDAVPTDDPAAIRAFLDDACVDYFFHVAMGAPEWAALIAAECAERGIGVLYTSSVSVFSGRQRGPLRPEATPDAEDDYGRYKADCEARILASNPSAVIVRLGWQIGTAPGSNNMVDYLHKTVDPDGNLEVSRRWFPACSFLADTADTLASDFKALSPGVYHLDGNPGWSMYEIASGLARLHGWSWNITPTDAPAFNNLMEDPRLAVRPITGRLAVS